jgi:PAP2 superfamily
MDILHLNQAFIPPAIPARRSSPLAAARPARHLAIAARADLGLNGLSLTLAALQLATVALLAALYARSGLTIAWSTALSNLICLGGLGAIWLYLFVTPGRARRTWALAETIAVLLLTMSFGMIAVAGQYLVATLQRPLVDVYLASADRLLGVSVPGLVAWARHHEWVADALRFADFTLAPQIILAIIVVGVVLRDRGCLWELAFHYHFCLLVTLAASGLFPAECAFTFYGFESLIDQGRFIHHFESLRAGTFQAIRFNDIEGLISFPSFHAAGGLMVTWAFRGRPAWQWPLIVLNTGLIAATFLTGAHYVVDVLATLVMFFLSVCAYRRLVRSLG